MVILLTLAAGLALLIAGGELLVSAAGRLGRAAGLSPVVVGLTVVAGATSSPEFAVSLDAALTDAPGLAVGNVVGSNTANALLVLGLAALVRAQHVDRRLLLQLVLPTTLAASLAVLVLSLDGTLGRLDGALLVAGLGGYLTVATARGGRFASLTRRPPAEPVRGRVRSDLLRLASGVVLLLLGAGWLVQAAIELAVAVGVSDLVIGLTVVAVGTALPEITTSVVAAVRGDREMAVGNVIGSNIFNLAAVLGVTALTIPVPVDAAAVRFDMPVMIAATVALAAMLFTGSLISRPEGAVLAVWFVAYVGYLVLDAEGHDALPAYSAVLLYLCAPITVLVLVGLGAREVRAQE